jgi:two-component system, sensor histidine kinase FlrB
MPNALDQESRLSSLEVTDSPSLLRAFSFFTKAAGSLERSYLQLETEVCRLRQELEEANRDLQREREEHQRCQVLAEVSSMLAHEIRNPLGSLELLASLLADSGPSETQKHWIRHMQAGLRMLAATVNNVLHLHSGNTPQLVRSDLGELLHWTVEFLTPLAEQNGIRLELQNQLVGVHMPADVHGLRQVLLNLALNGFRHMTEGGVLRVLASRENCSQGERIRVEVEDQGTGIAPEHLDHIFDAGFTTRPGSAGLGLAVSKKIVEQHGGTIRVTSEVGQGTTFTITFPTPGSSSL